MYGHQMNYTVIINHLQLQLYVKLLLEKWIVKHFSVC